MSDVIGYSEALIPFHEADSQHILRNVIVQWMWFISVDTIFPV